jgi:fructose-specific phosphotransferase system IIC component
MKSPLSVIFALTVLAALSSGLKVAQKAVVFSYPDATPQDIVDAAMDKIVALGGMVTHEFKLFKSVLAGVWSLSLTSRRGFAATIPPKSVEMVSALSSEFVPMVEEDQIMNTQEA